MAIVPAGSRDGFVDLDVVGNSAESLGRLLDAQRELFHSQIEQLQRLVVAQCKLTGVNPLAQEMAAGALSIKIGKKPRDLLNPKAINYMQSVFSIKDTIGKKETREISALCGVAITQVREFFAGQRSRVRKLVRLSREKATRTDVSNASHDGCSTSSDQILPATTEVLVCASDIKSAEDSTQIPQNLGNNIPVVGGQQVLVNSSDLKPIEGGSSCSQHEETIVGVDSDDKKFLENIFNLMRKEETFSGQVKLMEWVLQIRDTAVLNWFLTKGGIAILATWLTQASVEEQTTVLLVIFKVLCHLPLHKALPAQMSAILQAVNRLRFYRTSDISNRARILLSRWSKLFVRNQALKKPFTNSPKDAQKAIIRKQRINAILNDEAWRSKIDIPEEILALSESSENSRKREPRQALNLLLASSDESTKKRGRTVSSSKTKERRKVLLVEQPDHKTAGRSAQIARAVPSNHSRPISADDIQKAKMRANFLQNKYGKTGASTSENQSQKVEHQNAASSSQPSKMLPESGVPMLPQMRRHEDKKPLMPSTKASPLTSDASVNSISDSSHIPSWEKLKSDHIRWHTPPAVKINSLWRMGAGESSKEVEVQTERIRREKETFYASKEDIPPNPKEPWDTEMDFDDSLTPEIPIEQPPDIEPADGSLCSPHSPSGNMDVSRDTPATTAVPLTSNGPPEPDLELLAVLLKNPDVVFALTSGQGNGLNSEQMVALLDVLKNSGVGLAGVMNGMVGSSKEPEPVSLPSPTPPSERNGWRSETSPFAKNQPPLQSQLPATGAATTLPTLLTRTPHPSSTSMVVRAQTSGLGMHPQSLKMPTTVLSMPHVTVPINPSQHLPVLNTVMDNIASRRPRGPLVHQALTSAVYPVHQSSDVMLHMKHHSRGSHPAVPSLVRQEPLNFRQAHNRIPSPSVTSYPTLHSVPQTPQPPSQNQPPFVSPNVPTWPLRTVEIGKRDLTWNGQPNGLSDIPGPNPHTFANQNDYGMYNKGIVQASLGIPGYNRERTELLGGADLETWSQEGSPMRSPDFQGSLRFSEPRRERGWDQKPERQWNPGNRDHRRSGGSGKRRRDRDRRH